MDEQSDAAIAVLLKLGINLVGIDFDQTFTAEHTRGKWTSSAQNLAVSSRLEFIHLVPKLIKYGIKVAIVTFSGQAHLIDQVLTIAFGTEIANQIVIRARDGSWGNPGDSTSMRDGKQKFLASAAEQFERLQPGLVITRGSTLLIDDDPTNIQIALDRGVRALWFMPETPENLMLQIQGLPV